MSVKSILKESKKIDPLIGQGLTQAEQEILELTIAGKHDKEIASLLGRSVRTVEWYRKRIMRKLNVDSIVDLVRTTVRSQ